MELKQLEYQKQTDEKFDKVFEYINDHAESEQKIFFDGQIYDAFGLLISLVQKVKKKIVLIEIPLVLRIRSVVALGRTLRPRVL